MVVDERMKESGREEKKDGECLCLDGPGSRVTVSVTGALYIRIVPARPDPISTTLHHPFLALNFGDGGALFSVRGNLPLIGRKNRDCCRRRELWHSGPESGEQLPVQVSGELYVCLVIVKLAV
jgi:hypothetical protein